MKKLVALLVGLLIIGISATTVSAEEYEVKKGDTLWDIAKEYNITVETLIDINGLNSSLIHPEQVLEIDEVEIEYHTVKQGDTLEKISNEYAQENEAVTILNLKAWNDLSSDLIVTGEKLIVNGSADAAKESRNEDTVSNDTDVSEAETEVFNTASAEENSEPETKEEPVEQKSEVEGKTISVEATAYTAYCAGCSGITATGINLKEDPHAKVIAVDPNVIPLGTKVYVEGYGHAIAGDTGGAIKGNKIDIHVPTKDEAFNWGRRVVELTILE